ncbi:immunoglobulin-like domain-containing protein [Paenibacillus cymbidii]|uniref:immunoglobulin-like domain-containing protein n=1 Tax=Paenibacillus cymbidii TaxID=1639034 RepID=UPI00107FD96F|nr:immunoglobulin-like domain-containing protein [Paenibacillus cymbidii]
MRKIVLLVLAGLLGAGSWLGTYPATVQAADPYSFSAGHGLPGDPYVVLTAEDMDHVRDELGADYILGADIDLSGYAAGSGWQPIGTYDATPALSHPFTGTFDGNQFTITGLFINLPSDRIGLFGFVEDAVLRNIRLENVNVTGAGGVGGLAGLARSTKITNSSVSGSLNATSNDVGGLVGYMARAGAGIQDSYSAADVTGNTGVGGLVGMVDASTDGIERSYASGNVSGVMNVGGLIGSSYGPILNSYAAGNVHASGTSGERAGGIAAYLQGNLFNSFQTGTVTGSLLASLVYRRDGGSIANSFYNTSSSAWPAVRNGDPGSGYLGLSDADMKKASKYGAGLDFAAIWGIQENLSYPYLRHFKPIVRLDVTATTYGSINPLTVSGSVIDGSMGEPVQVTYEIRDSSNQLIVTDTQPFAAATGVNQRYSFEETLDNARFPEGAVYTVKVMARDDEGHDAPVRSATFIADYTPPVITLDGANPMVVERGDPYVEPGATALDAIDGDVTGKMTISGAVDTNRVGSYTRTYEVVDGAGNRATEVRTVNVVDTVAPVIALNGANPIQITAGSAFVDPWATAQDAVDGDLTVRISVSGTVDANQAGSYSLTYNVQDNSGNAAASVVRTVIVVRSDSDDGDSGGSPPIVQQRSGNAELAQLTLRMGGTEQELTPAFAPGITEYAMETDAAQVELQLAVADPKAKVKLQNEPVGDTTRIPLIEGTQTIEMTVQAEDGTVKVYRLTITRRAVDNNESVPSPASPPACPFTDIEGHWAEADICEAAGLKIVEGVSANLFVPDQAVTRAEFAVMLLRTLQIPIVPQSDINPFTDSGSIPEWAQSAIYTGAVAGVLQGYPDGTFQPQRQINRAEMATMLARAMKWETNGESDLPYSDGANIPVWAQDYVKAVHANGLVQGRENNQFVPNGMTTRAEAAVVMLRLSKLRDHPPQDL